MYICKDNKIINNKFIKEKSKGYNRPANAYKIYFIREEDYT